MPCCQCCTKQRTAQIFLVLGAAVLIISFVLAAALIQVVSQALRSNAVIPTPAQSNWRDWLSNVPSDQRNGDAAATFYTFYFFNLTNLDAVALADADPQLQEYGPYVYQSFSKKIESTVSYNSDNSQVSYQTWSWKVFRADLSHGNDDYNDKFIIPDLAYQNALGYENSPFVGKPEGAVRVALVPGVINALAGKVFLRLTLQATGTATPLFTNPALVPSHFFFTPATLSYGGNTYSSVSPLFTSLLNNVSRTRTFTTMPNVEYYRVVNVAADPASLSLAATTDSQTFTVSLLSAASAIAPNSTGVMTSPVPVAAVVTGVGCTDFRFSNTLSSFQCWSLLPQTLIQTYGLPFQTAFDQMSLLVSSKYSAKQMMAMHLWFSVVSGVAPLVAEYAAANIVGLNSYPTLDSVLDNSFAEWTLASMGHQGRKLGNRVGTRAPGFPASSNVYPSWPTSPIQSTGNAYVLRNPRSIAYESCNIFTGVALSTQATIVDPLNSGVFTNYSNQNYAMLYNNVETDGTGQVNITEADNIYQFNSYTTRSAGKGTGFVFCNSTLTSYPVQGGFTKATPRYAPGIVGTNPFSIGKSVLDKNFVVDVWSSDISRRIQLAYLSDADMSDIKLIRYNFSYPNLVVNYDLNQPYEAVLSSTCTSGTAILTLPRWQAADIFPNPPTSTSMSAQGVAVKPVITYLDIDTVVRDNIPPSGDKNDLQPFLDLEPISGALMRGSLREQVNLWFYNPIKAGAASASQIAFNPKRYTVWPVLWINRNGQATSKQIDTFKAGVYGVSTAATVILIVGSIIGGLTFVISFVLLVKYAREDSERTPYGTQPSSTNLNM